MIDLSQYKDKQTLDIYKTVMQLQDACDEER